MYVPVATPQRECLAGGDVAKAHLTLDRGRARGRAPRGPWGSQASSRPRGRARIQQGRDGELARPAMQCQETVGLAVVETKRL